jgi:hypothetical protein
MLGRVLRARRRRLRDDPVILLGMHSSGTSIAAEVLHRHGVFMGADMAHHESRFFTMEIDDELILGGGAGWARDPILSVDAVLAKLDAARRAIDAGALPSYRRAGYNGRSQWGFKDPRACVTLPLFLEIFPQARLLHIVRDERDVAASLSRSTKAGLGRLDDPEHWISLQRQHVARAREYGERHGDYHEFAYEEFCRRPVEVMRPVFERLELRWTPKVECFLTEHVYTHRIGAALAPAADLPQRR